MSEQLTHSRAPSSLRESSSPEMATDQKKGRLTEAKTCKACDQCRNRKVRCIMDPQQRSRCIHCIKRNETCHFTQTKRKLRSKAPQTSRNHTTSRHHIPLVNTWAEKACIQPTLSSLFLDQILENKGRSSILRDNFALLRASDHDVTSSSLAFFTEHRINSLSHRLGNDRLRELVENIESVIRSRLLAEGPSSISHITFGKPSDTEDVSLENVRLYVNTYFHQLHPIYPFLDRQKFEDKVFGPNLSETLASSCAFSALYHTILALGCQYHEGGAFDPGNGRAWKLFQVSLGLVSDILIPREALMSLQALVAMSIFATTTCCLQIDEILLMEAARMAQSLGYHRALSNGDQRYKDTCHRTFWVIYYMEKGMCFQNHKGSMIPDHDIGCPVPDVPESVFEGHNWFLSAISFGRILSLAYTSLFSVSAAIQPPESYYAAIQNIEARLERWRSALPEHYRPGRLSQSHKPHVAPCSSSSFIQPSFKTVVLQTKFSYYGLIIALARLKVYIGRQDQSPSQEKNRRLLMDTARAVVEESKNIDIAAYTPLFILATLPLGALFILFDFVIHNPMHPETPNNLSLLDVAAGHFSLLEYKSGGFVPASLLTEFAHIARQYIRDYGRNQPQHQQQEEAEVQEREDEERGAGPCEIGSSNVESTLAFQDSEQLAQTNNPTSINDVCLQDDIMEFWDPSDYLHYPVTADTTVHGSMPENMMAASFNIQSLFGFVVPEFGHDL
ncbi:Zn(II)2Cys6 transcription factor [Aspergillus vadensis CBS 113365]|uniref:Zn(2)-C6 fungal-type domain-containing protein n=1 Tax=Aspergillus vadensis (strain CBS 113365 / IMI 142717 / IBT 24658) TaxID=1448311 RepID=A0A319B8M9_ASPVC|nr:hypothetical protein BO88DRAFT_388534 [Aspergillus vadensis CBS 113365]PYH69236.1 hypothetical protein BO88DRAFT_388534 [Aspergillus vadensis CBS 113365]